ncbi:MAG: YkgJ family cysteine cluster protein [Candidatus Omnitrophica bacterium]|nr:YkgJ family cysteine cluster protein [Candidatus Omnitrophota bacterium]
MKRNKKITEKEFLKLCNSCISGSCCQDGVEVDLEEAKKISRLKIKLRKPWFENLSKDKDMPSGWAVSTTVRNNRCVFQKGNYKCLIYPHRPTYCRDFPLEHGKIAQYYHYLCEKPTSLKRKARRDLRHIV